MIGCDSPEQFGWGRIADVLASDGICGFRLLGTQTASDLRMRLAAHGYRLDTWSVFVGNLADYARLATPELPDGFSERQIDHRSSVSDILQIQELMLSVGVVPFSASMLTGEIGQSATIAIENSAGRVIATAQVYMPHNAFSPFHSYAWGGLVAVDPTCRGIGLGKAVNQRIIHRALVDFGASHIYELISVDNAASRRMVEACGLSEQPALVCGVATPSEGARFTK